MKHPSRIAALGTLAATALVVALYVAVGAPLGTESGRPVPADRDTGAASLASEPSRAGAVPTDRAPTASLDASRQRRLPASLRGTKVDGALVVDEAGRFQATHDAIELFDYFLSATGEEPYEDLVARIVAEIHARLGPEAARDAVAFLERYLDYRERALALEGEAPLVEDLATGFERLVALRRDVFGDVVASNVFAEEEAAARVTLAQREVAADANLSAAERERRIEALYDALPEPARQAREQAVAALALRRDEARLRADGASADDIEGLRTERFGPEAAARLADLDRRRADWDARVAAFRSSRQAIEADASLSESEKASRIDALLEESFSEPERLRVGALERIAAGTSR